MISSVVPQVYRKTLVLIVSTWMIAGCTSTWLPSAGPSYNQIDSTARANNNGVSQEVRVVDVDAGVVRDTSLMSAGSFAVGFPETWRSASPNLLLGKGDGIQISIFEAPPSVLLSTASAALNASDLAIGSGSGVLNLPDQMVSQEGTIVVPFAGPIPVAGKTLSQVEQIIRGRLSKLANQPQVVARLSQNASNSVVVLADGRSLRMPLTAKGERLLDALPLAGDAKKVKNTSIRLTRRGVTHTVSAISLSQNPTNNIYLQPGDVVSVLQDPYRITVLGATNANAVIDFGDDGLSVAEALGRVSGLNDFRADPRGVFVFRRPSLVASPEIMDDGQVDVQHRLPTVFRLNVRDAQGMVLAQNFKLQDKDMLYVSNASSVQLQKVLNLFNSTLTPVVNSVNAVNAFGN